MPAVSGMDLRVYWEAEQEWRVGTVVEFDLQFRQVGMGAHHAAHQLSIMKEVTSTNHRCHAGIHLSH